MGGMLTNPISTFLWTGLGFGMAVTLAELWKHDVACEGPDAEEKPEEIYG